MEGSTPRLFLFLFLSEFVRSGERVTLRLILHSQLVLINIHYTISHKGYVGMINKVKLLCLLICVLFLIACDAKETNKEEKQNNNHDELVHIDATILAFNLTEGAQDADLIAEIEIIGKIEEVDENPIPYSVFQAKVNHTIKGNEDNEKITIKQEGTKEWPFSYLKPFHPGEKYILFMKKIVAGEADYWFFGADTGMFYINSDEHIVKLGEPLDELKDIERSSETFDETHLTIKEGEMQILDKEKFIQRVKEKLN